MKLEDAGAMPQAQRDEPRRIDDADQAIGFSTLSRSLCDQFRSKVRGLRFAGGSREIAELAR